MTSTPNDQGEPSRQEPEREPEHVLAVVLAAGGGTRFAGDEHKLLAVLDGKSVIEHAVAAAAASAIGPVLVVTGAARLPESLAATPAVRIVDNPRWAEGQASSLATAIAVAVDEGFDAVVVGLGDQPFVDPRAWRSVAASRAPIAIATYDGRRRNPVRLHRSVWALLPTTGDEGARALTRVRPDLVDEVPCSGSPADIDTLEDLLRWQSKSSTNSP